MTITLSGQDTVIHGSIGPISSDNLGAHSIGGYIESFSSLRLCRVCMGTSDDIQTKASILYIIIYILISLQLQPQWKTLA